MRRLVITGLPCPKEPWERFLGTPEGQRILTIREVFENTTSSDPREMSRYITREIEDFAPDSLVCHDMGVPLTLLSLLRLNRRGKCLNTCVTLFNGAFRRVNLLRANHPFRLQFMSDRKAIDEVESHGGAVDPLLRPYLPRIRAMYRIIILYGLTEKVGSLIGLDDLVGFPDRTALLSPMQVIASRNDPYIPWESIEQLKEDIQPKRFTIVDYGHFPYTAPAHQILPLIEAFEAEYGGMAPQLPLEAAPSRLLF